MKKGSYILIAGMISIGIVSCRRDNIIPASCKAMDGKDTAVFVGHVSSLIFGGCSSGLQATVSNINDSRCPTGAVCAYAGMVYVDLQLENQFNIRLEQYKQKDTIYQGQKYSFTLTDVTPYPNLNTPPPPHPETYIRIIRQ